MKFAAWLAAGAGLAVAVTACTAPTARQVSASSSPSAAGTTTTGTLALARSASPGKVLPGSDDCAFSATNGGWTVYVAARDVAACGEVSAALASFATNWTPVDWSTFTSQQGIGSLPDSLQYCGLARNGGTTMTVYEVSTVHDPVGGGLAADICTSEEANGWTAETEGAAG